MLWAALETSGQTGLSLLTFIILARLLGPAEFGLAALALIIIQVLILFIEAPFIDPIVQRAALEPTHLDTAFWSACFISLLLLGSCIASADYLARIFQEPRLATVIPWLALSMVFSALSTIPVARLRRELRFKELTLRSLISRIAGAVVGIALAYSGYGVWSLVAQALTTGGVATAILWITEVWRPRLRFSTSHLRQLGEIGVPILATQIVSAASGRIYNIVIGYFLGITAAGYWNVALRVTETLTAVLAQAAGQVGLSVFSRRQSELRVLREGFYFATQMSCLLSVPLFVSLIVLADVFVKVVFGDRWLPVVPIIQIIAFGSLVYCPSMIADIVLYALGQPRWSLIRSCAQLLLSGLGVLIFYQSTLTVIAIVWVGIYLLTLPLMFIALRRYIGLDFRVLTRSVAVPVLAGMIECAAVLGIKTQIQQWPGLLTLGVLVPVGVLIYIVLIRVLAPTLFSSFVRLAKIAVARQPVTPEFDSSRNY